MPKSKTPKRRKTFDFSDNTQEMLDVVRQSIKAETESEALRWIIAQAYHLQKALDEGNQILIRDDKGGTRALLFV